MRADNVYSDGAKPMGKNIKTVVLGLVLGACLTGCGAESQSATSPAKTASGKTPSTHTPSDTHIVILEIIENGNKARAEMNGNGLNDAAGKLRQIGAVPLNEDTSDLAKEWSDTAKTLPTETNDTPPYRGRVKGPAYRKEILAGGAELVLEEIYYASEKAELTLKTLSGEGLDVAVQIQPQAGEAHTDAPVCRAKANAAPASCEWLPLWTAKYNITITNHGENPVPYVLVTN